MAATAPSGDLERWVELERALEAAPDRVYRAWTDPEELARWFPSAVEGSLAVGTRSILVWPDERISWEVMEATPESRLVVRHGAPDERPLATLTLRIEPRGLGSRVVLHDGPYPIDMPAGLDAWAAAIERWTEVVTMLRAYLDFFVDLRPRW